MKLTKEDVQNRVLQNGKPLAFDKFDWDAETRTFSSEENDLVIDFNGINNCTFSTGSECTFNTGDSCTFKTGYNCTFNTGYDCTFNTGGSCTFNTGADCIFNTGAECTFNTSAECIFETSGSGVIYRRDTKEIIPKNENETIELFPYNQKGYLVNGLSIQEI